jgi:hypothetical protein
VILSSRASVLGKSDQGGFKKHVFCLFDLLKKKFAVTFSESSGNWTQTENAVILNSRVSFLVRVASKNMLLADSIC